MKKALKPLFDLAKKVQKNLNADETADQEFLEKVKEQIEDFKKSRQRVLHLEPMNSYERRLVHNLAPEYGLQSYSEGEDDERHLVLSKEKDKKAAEEEKTEERPKRRAKLEPTEEEKPARGARRDNGSYNARSRKSEDSGETDNEEFLATLKQEVAKFQKSKEKAHHLAPMNSYQRMLVHTLAKELELFSASEGDDEERHIVLYKEEPPKSAARPAIEKRDREEKPERKPFPRREGRADENRDRGERSDRGGERDFRSRRPRDDRNAVAEGDREFFVPIQEGGVEIILDDTGFVGLEGANPSAQIIDRKHIKLGSFKVRDGKIVTIEDKEW